MFKKIKTRVNNITDEDKQRAKEAIVGAAITLGTAIIFQATVSIVSGMIVDAIMPIKIEQPEEPEEQMDE